MNRTGRSIQIFAAMVLAGAMPGRALAQTELDLSATGTQMVAPDEIVAVLQGQDSSANAAAAQGRVNQMMKKALALTASAPGVVATTSDYGVQDIADDPSQTAIYQVSQTLTLVAPTADGAPAAGFTDLVGQMQGQGFLLQSLDGDLSPGARSTAAQAAIRDAMAGIADQAAAISKCLNEPVDGYKTVTVTDGSPDPVEGARVFAKMKVAAPQAALATLSVEVNVSATVLLRPPG